MEGHVKSHVFHRARNKFSRSENFLFFFQAEKIFNFGGKSAKVKIASPRVNMIDRRLEEAF